MSITANRTDERLTLSRHIDAPVEAVWSLIAGLHQQPARFGRHRLDVDISPGRGYPLRYRLTTGHAVPVYSAEIKLSPSHDGGAEMAWEIARRSSPWRGRGGHAKFAAAVAEFAARLASQAEDLPTTRAEWADRRYELAA